jgi:hypothetical protein
MIVVTIGTVLKIDIPPLEDKATFFMVKPKSSIIPGEGDVMRITEFEITSIGAWLPSIKFDKGA